MSWTKLQLITKAYEKIGLANYVFDLEPEQLQSACSTLDGMIGSWNGLNLNIGYNLSTSPDSTDPAQDSGLPDYANQAAYLNLALLLALDMGKQTSPVLVREAIRAYDNLRSAAMSIVRPRQLPSTMPRGAGQKYWRGIGPFINPPTNPLDADQGNELDLD